MATETFTVVTGGPPHIVRSYTCPGCAPVWPQRCSCGQGRVHAEEHAIQGGWGPSLVRYACDVCGASDAPDGVSD
jgi:hypothetical protein